MTEDPIKPIDPMPDLWAEFLKTNPGPEFKPWDEMDKLEQAIMRIQVFKVGTSNV